MSNVPFIRFAFIASALFLGACTVSSTTPAGPVIDSLDVPATTSQLTVSGQTGPGFTMTLTAHDDSAGMTELHTVFTETGADHTTTLPGSPTDLKGQQITLVILNAPKGPHPVSFHLSDAQGHTSAVIDKTITVP